MKLFKRLCAVKLLLFGIIINVNAQTSIYENHYINHHSRVIPETPNAASFTIYGDIPVNHATGVPQIDIPIYTIEEDGVQIPISLSYHASGVRVDELATAVGLKWTLNAGGGVFRTVKELPDEYGWLTTNFKGPIRQLWDDSNVSHYLFHTSTLPGIVKSTDHFPDDFSYSIPGYSGSFFFGDINGLNNTLPDGQTDLERLVMKDYDDATKIEPLSFLPDSEVGFKIYDPVGNLYFLGNEKEINDTRSASGNNIRPAEISDHRTRSITGWMLDKIQTKNGSTIDFTYESYNFKYLLRQTSQSITRARYCDPSPQDLAHRNFCACEGQDANQSAGNPYEYISSTSVEHNPENKLIKSIDTKTVQVRFNYEDESSASTWKKKLTSIVIYDKITGQEKSFQFDYSFFPGDRRLRLDAIQEIGFDGDTSKPPHKFFYTSGSLPLKNSKSRDLKGYFNGKSNSTLVPFTQIANARLSQYASSLGDRSHNPDVIARGTLNQIQYPTGGSTKFVYEPNAILSTSSGNTIFNTKRVRVAAAGQPTAETFERSMFRQAFTVGDIISGLDLLGNINTYINIRSSSNLCDFNENDQQHIDCSNYRVYRANTDGSIGELLFDKEVGTNVSEILGSGDYILELDVLNDVLQSHENPIISVDLDWKEKDPLRVLYTGGIRVASVKNYDVNDTLTSHLQYEYEGLTGDFSPLDFYSKAYGDGPEKWVFSSENISLDPLLRKPGHFYKKVTINQVDIRPTLGESKKIKTVEKYTQKFHNQSVQSQLLKQWLYSEGEIIRTRRLIYKNSNLKQVQFWSVGEVDECINYLNAPAGDPSSSRLGYSEPESNILYSRSNVLEKEEITDYLSGGSITTSTAYTYNQHYQINTQVIQHSGGQHSNGVVSTTHPTTHVRYTYPNIYPSLSYLDNSDRHIVASPVSVEVNNNGGMALGQYFTFDQQGNVTGSYTYNQELEGETPLLDYIPSGYELSGSFKIEEGLPIEVNTRQGVPITYIWSYHGKYPVAKIENATSVQVAEALGIETPGLADFDQTSLNLIDNLRPHLSQAFITTYQYRPLVGIISSKDPNGLVTEYDYDGYGRLKHVTDHESNLLRTIKYQYYLHQD